MTGAPTITVNGRRIGSGEPTYVIAELSANHHHELDLAKELVHAAAESGADAVKLQTYTPDTMTIAGDQPWFRVGDGTLWAGRSLHDLYAEAATPWEWHAELASVADGLGLTLFSTPYDPTSVRFLQEMDVPAYKVASFELVDLPLIRQMASLGKPMIISTGMASLVEIDAAMTAAREAGAKEIALLRCNSAYPADPAEMDLATIPHLAAAWEVPVGLSDHTLGSVSAVVAVALGASLLEKHIALSRDREGPDTAFSLEPDEFKRMVGEVRTAERVVGRVRYGPSSTERASLAFRRSLYVVEDIEAGGLLTTENVRSIRPSGGLPPDDIDLVVGRRASRRIERGTPLAWELIGDVSGEPGE